MPLITEYHKIKEIYRDAAQRRVGLPVFCAEDRETLEAILAATLEFGQEIGVADLPIIPAWTVRYPGRGQMTLLTACGDPRLGTRLMFSDLRAFMSEDSPYRQLRVMPHLDHGFPWLDGDIMEAYADQFASIMCDASERPFEENIRLTAEYVDRMRGRVVVEGAVDEIFEAGGMGSKNEPTTVEQARRFVSETGVDLIVPNVGTEHRATADQVVYRAERAQEISAAVGPILCLHGTSSVKPADLARLPADGFVKINVYTTLAVHGGQAVAREVLRSLPGIFDQAQLQELVSAGVVPQAALTGQAKPKLAVVANPPRRDAWFGAVKRRCQDFLRAFNYAAYGKDRG